MGSYFEQRMEEIAAKPHLVAAPPKQDGRRAFEPSQPLRGTKAGTIYFATSDLDKVKIGFTTNLYSRVKSLQTGNPEPITVIECFESYKEAERMIHARFAADRINREWFHMSDDIDDFIYDIIDYQGCHWIGEDPTKVVSDLGEVFFELDDLQVMLANVGTPWQDIDHGPACSRRR